MAEIENVQGRKIRVPGGGRCVYCGSDGGADGLRDEHAIPYSLGGTAELLKASCSDCEKVTSYLGWISSKCDVKISSRAIAVAWRNYSTLKIETSKKLPRACERGGGLATNNFKREYCDRNPGPILFG